MTDEWARWTALQSAAAVRAGNVTPTQVVTAALARAEAAQAAFNAFTVIRHEAALAEASALNAGGVGLSGPLAGVPVVVKEEFDIAGHPTTLGGRGNSTPARADSAVIRRIRAAGAIIIGITTMPEFGQFTVTESIAHGVTRNPWDPTRSPGGSSGGSAAAVAAGVAPIGLGADGGGSIRIPASCCNLVGLKLTRGRSTFAPLAEHWFGLVVPGGVTRTVDDTALLLDVLAGNTPVDRWRWTPPQEPYAVAARRDPGVVRVAWTTRPVTPGLTTDPQIAAATEQVARALQSLGHRPRQVGTRWPVPTDAFLPQFYAGMRVEGALVEHPEVLEPRTRQTIALSRWATDRVVDWALRRGERVAAAVDERFLRDADLLLLPTMPVPVPPVGLLEGMNTVRAQTATLPYVSNMAIFNVSGHPAISVPAGLSAEGWPIGVQLVARRGREDLLLAVARQLEAAFPSFPWLTAPT
ncbi:MAG: amidase [Phycicoccus sp.]|nr:amidase [Phycicoccus sp.]